MNTDLHRIFINVWLAKHGPMNRIDDDSLVLLLKFYIQSHDESRLTDDGRQVLALLIEVYHDRGIA